MWHYVSDPAPLTVNLHRSPNRAGPEGSAGARDEKQVALRPLCSNHEPSRQALLQLRVLWEWHHALAGLAFGNVHLEKVEIAFDNLNVDQGSVSHRQLHMRFRYIEGFYNPRRRHSAPSNLSPADFERRLEQRQLQAAASSSWVPTGAGQLQLQSWEK